MAVQTSKKSAAPLPWPALIPLGHHQGKPPISLAKMVILVGSRHNAHLHLLSRHVSKAHAIILSFEGSVYIRDLASREGVYINGQPVREAWLQEGDLVKIGSFTFKFKDGPATSGTPDEPPYPADLEIPGLDSPLSISEKVMLIGRRPTCDVSLIEASVSTAHAVIFHVGGKRYVRDLGSRTGTYVNGKKVHQEELNPGNTLHIGETEMLYSSAEAHDHAIAPVDQTTTVSAVDELEDLVGTAPLDMATEIESQSITPEAQRQAAEFAAGFVQPRAKPTDDFIPLELDPEPLEPVQVEPVKRDDDPLGIKQEDLAEIDLMSDPDVSGPGETHAIGLEIERPARKPEISPRVTDDALELEPEAPPQMLMDKDLLEQRLSSSATGADLAADAKAAMEMAGEVAPAPHSAAKDEELIPLDEELAPAEEVQPVEEAPVEVVTEDDLLKELEPVAEVPAPVPEEPASAPVDEDEPLEELEPVAEEAPAIEKPAVVEESVSTTPVEEPVVAQTVFPPDVTTEPVTNVTPEAVEEQVEPEQPSPVAEEPAPVIDEVRAPLESAADVTEQIPVVTAPPDVAPTEAIAEAPQTSKRRGRKTRSRDEARARRKKPGETTETEQTDVSTTPAILPAMGGVIAGTVALASATASEDIANDAGEEVGNAPLPITEGIPPAVPDETPVAEEAESFDEAFEGRRPDVDEPAPPVETKDELESVAAALAEEPAEISHTPAAPEPITVVAHEPPAVEEISTTVKEATIEETPVEATPDELEPVEVLDEVEEAPQPAAEIPTIDDPILEEARLLSEEPEEEPVTLEPVDDEPRHNAAPTAELSVNDTLPVLDLEADLEPPARRGDPDELLALDQVDPDALDEVEVIESTEPTAESALELEAVTEEPPADSADSLSDSTFGKQVEEFTATSSGDIVEEPAQPVPTGAQDAEEELAIALGQAEEELEKEGIAPPPVVDALEELEALEPIEEADDLVGQTHIGPVDVVETNVTEGGIEPAAMNVVTDQSLASEHFATGNEAVESTETIAPAGPVDLQPQSFESPADSQQIEDLIEEVAPPESLEPLAEEAQPLGEGDVTSLTDNFAPPQEPPQRPASGGGGLFTLGADLASYIGGMPLNLPNLAPPPSNFGRPQIVFDGVRAPWEQAPRKTLPMGNNLASELAAAAEGLRDVEEMDDGVATESEESMDYDAGEDADLILEEGAPADEWNIGAVMDEDEEKAEAAPEGEPLEEAPSEEPLEELPELEEEPIEEEPAAEIDESIEPIAEIPAEALEETEAQPAEDQPIGEDQLLEELEIGNETQFDQAGLPPEPIGDIEPPADEPVAEEAASEPLVEEAPIEELKFEEPMIDLPMGTARLGALDEAVAELKFDDQEPVDRTPAPPLGIPESVKEKAPPAAAPQQRPMVIPPPPARSPRRGKAAAQPPADDAATDAIFGAMEHGTSAPEGDVDIFSQGAAFAAADSNATQGLEIPRGKTRSKSHSNGEEPEPANGDDTAVAQAPRRRPQRVIVPPRLGELGMGAAAAEAITETAAAAVYRTVPRRKSLAKRVLIVVLLMLACMAAAVGGIYYFKRPTNRTEGVLQFNNVGALARYDLIEFEKRLNTMLTSKSVNMTALGIVAGPKGVPAGFLASPEQYGRLSGAFSSTKPGAFIIRWVGHDKDDLKRIEAVLTGLYQENARAQDDGIRMRGDIEKLEKQLATLAQLRAQQTALAAQLKDVVTEDQLIALEAKARDADIAYERAAAALKGAQMELAKVEQQSAPPDVVASAANDPELLKLRKTLEDSATRLAAVKSSASEEADARSKELDSAIEQFQQMAAAMAKDNPNLRGYVTAVQQMQERIAKLSGDLIEVQQQHHNRLAEYKKNTDEFAQTIRNQKWAADKELNNLRALLDLAQRRYNAAVDQGYAPDSKEVTDALAEIKLATDNIDTRKKLVADDPLSKKYEQGLAEIIHVTSEKLASDRDRIEKDIKEQEAQLAGQAVPAEQQAAAAQLRAKIAAVNELRKQHAAALDKKTAASNQQVRDLETAISDAKARIDERQRYLASASAAKLTPEQEAARKIAVEKAQAALKTAQENHDKAFKLSVDREKDVKLARLAREERPALEGRRDAVVAQINDIAPDQGGEDTLKLTLERRKEELRKLVTAVRPTEGDARIVEKQDDRPLWSAGAVMGLALLFGIVLVFSVMGGEKAAGPQYVEAGPMAIEQLGIVEGEEAIR